MSFRPSRLMLRVALALAGVSILLTPWDRLVWIGPGGILILLGLAVLDLLGLRLAIPPPIAEHEIPPMAALGRAFTVQLKIRNPGGRRLMVKVREVLPAGCEPKLWIERLTIGPRQTALLDRTLQIATRGDHALGPLWVLWRGWFHMLERQMASVAPANIKIMPPSAVPSETLEKDRRAEKILLDKESRRRLQGEGSEFESLDEYRPGHDLRRVDWRASARHHRLIVRRYVVEQHRDLVVLIDCGRLMGSPIDQQTKLDCAVDAALMLCRVALAKGDRCGLGIFDCEVLGYLPPSGGTSSYRRLTEAVYNVQSRWQESNFAPMFELLDRRQRKRALVVVLSDLMDEQTTRRFRTSLARLSHRHLVLFAALQSPLVRRIAQEPIETIDGVARNTVALRLLREREKAMQTLGHAGVQILDVAPEELTVPLLNKYIALRERNLL